MTRRALLLGGGSALALGCGGFGQALPVQEGETERGRAGRGGGERPTGGRAGGRLITLEDRFEGYDRKAVLILPDGYDPGEPTPLVLVNHGSGHGPGIMYKANGWRRTLNEVGWIGVFPASGHLSPEPQDGSGDPDYMAFLVERVAREHAVDDERVYGVGFSGGCKRTYLFAAKHSGLLAAIGVAGGVIGHREDDPPLHDPAYWKAEPMSVLHIHGAKDRKVPVAGGPFTAEDGVTRQILPLREALGLWVEHAGCDEVAGAPRPEHCPARNEVTRWEAESGHAVQLVIDPDLAHEWPKDYANELITSFFASVPPRT